MHARKWMGALIGAAVLAFTVSHPGGSFSTYLAAFDDPIGGDINDDDVIDVADLVLMMLVWGPCPAQGPCTADLDDDGTVGVSDLVILILNWS